MLRALAIETSGRIGSIALAEDGLVAAERQFPHGLQHAAHIIPIIDELCRQRHWQPGQIDHVYVSAGPGSFTGLRIGITLVKTLWLATGVKVVAVPSVRVLVENAPADARQVVIVLDAKRDQIYTARFERSELDASGWHEMEPAHLDTLPAMLSRASRPLHLVGDGIPFHEKFIPQDDVGPAGIIVTPADTWRARASVVARLGGEMADRGEFADPLTLTPIYVRIAEAEEKYLAGQR